VRARVPAFGSDPERLHRYVIRREAVATSEDITVFVEVAEDPSRLKLFSRFHVLTIAEGPRDAPRQLKS